MRRGATLIELLVVLAMLGAMLAVTVPSFAAAEPAAPSLRGEIAAARRSAVSSGRPVVRTFELRGDRIRLSALVDGRVTLDSAGSRRTILAESADAPR